MKIYNQQLEAAFRKKGAELLSLVDRVTGQEYIWQADPRHWGRRAPVLFPFVGRLKQDNYLVGDKKFRMGQHGFARDMEFNLMELEEDTIRFSLSATPETLENYPYRFELLISYKLIERKLEITYEVANLESSDLYFSIGGHPAFNCPMIEGEKRADYRLEFSKAEDAQTHRLEQGLFSGKIEQIFQGKTLNLTEYLFKKDALVFKDLKSDRVMLVSDHKKWLTFHFAGFPYLGIWSKSDQSPFVCIEPWFGLADSKEHNQKIESKEGILCLKKYQTFSCSYQVEVH